jgi:hypothetical protein
MDTTYFRPPSIEHGEFASREQVPAIWLGCSNGISGTISPASSV